MALMESGEMYLESILVLSRERDRVRAVDVGEYLSVSKPAVSRALSRLKDGEYVAVDADGNIALSVSGREIAEKILERHSLLSEMFIRLGVDRETAVADACKIEHDLSEETFAALKRHMLRSGTDRTETR